MRWAASCVLLLAGACASAPPPRPAPPRPVVAPVYRSSIEAVLAHRAELGLTELQVEKLQAREQQRQGQEADLRAAHRAHAPSPGAQDAGAAPAAAPSGHMGGRHGGGHRGMGGQGVGANPPDLQLQLDDLDTRAYMEAEAALDEGQKEPARAVAEAYREQLWDYQQAAAQGRTSL